jgi:hypothetical protein
MHGRDYLTELKQFKDMVDAIVVDAGAVNSPETLKLGIHRQFSLTRSR